MCVIAYKPMGASFPNKKTLQTCFNHNPDGAGFMVATGKEVFISKGYMGFTSFWKALRKAREVYGDDTAYVMHFRISTQGGVRQDCCHPFPLTKSMGALRKLDYSSDIGVAHNGIISLCSTYSYKGGKTIDYSDTMSFITEYLSLIIKDRDYYKDADTVDLITKLCGSRLAILDGAGHCELVGSGWVHDEDMYYSNTSYIEARVSTTKSSSSYASIDWLDIYNDELYDCPEDNDPLVEYYNENTGLYDFTENDCPVSYGEDSAICLWCANAGNCWQYEVDTPKKVV